MNFVDPTGQDPNDPEPLSHIDSATGQPYLVPGINAGTVMADGSSSGIMNLNGVYDGDAHQSLTSINFLGGLQDPLVVNGHISTTHSRRVT